MGEKKGFWERLFGGGCSCGMDIVEDDADSKKSTKRSGCCNMEITEEPQNDSDSSAADEGRRS